MPFVLHGLCSSIAAGTGIVFNGYILVVLIWHRRIQTANNLLLLHLAFVDTVFCLVVLASNASIGIMTANSSTTSDGMDPSACGTHGFIWTLLPVVVIWTVCGLSCDRYAAISTPLHYSRLVNTRRATLFLLLVWVLGAVLALPPLFDICTYTFSEFRLACTASCARALNVDLGYALTYVILAVVLPVFIILLCNLHILTIARYHRHRIVSAIYQVTLSAQATVTHQQNPCYLSKFKGRNALLTIAQLVGSLVILAVPYFGVVIWEASSGMPANSVYVSVTTVLLTCTPPVNAYVYGVKSRVLRQTFKRLLQRHLYKREAMRAVEGRSSVSTSVTRRPLARRSSAPAVGYWDGPKSTLSRGTLTTSSVRVRQDPFARTHLPIQRRPSFMVDVRPSGNRVYFRDQLPFHELPAGSRLSNRSSTSDSASTTSSRPASVSTQMSDLSGSTTDSLRNMTQIRILFADEEDEDSAQEDGDKIKEPSSDGGVKRLKNIEPGLRKKLPFGVLSVRNLLPDILETVDDTSSTHSVASCRSPSPYDNVPLEDYESVVERYEASRMKTDQKNDWKEAAGRIIVNGVGCVT